MKRDENFKEKQYVTQISRNGEEKKFEIIENEEYGYNLYAAFCDNDYVYYLATERGNELSTNKKSKEKLILNRFSSKDFSHQRFVLDVPPVLDGEFATFWYYLGQNGNEKYIVSKNSDLDSEKNRFTIIAFSPEGKIIRTTKIELDLGGKFTRPAFNRSALYDGSYSTIDLDFIEKTSSSIQPGGSMSRSVVTTYSPTSGAYSHITLDPRSNHFYVFSLYGPKPFQKIGPIYEGFYIYKYDTNGNLIWKLQQPTLSDESYFRIHATPAERNITFIVLPDGIINFAIQFKDKLMNHEVSAEGKFIRRAMSDKVRSYFDGVLLNSTKNLKSGAIIKKTRSERGNKMVFFSSFLTKDKEILLQFDAMKDEIKLTKFNIEKK